MKTTLTDFQRRFREAREAADRGESVEIQSGGHRYIFERVTETTNPFEGLEEILGPATKLPADPRPLRERVRSRLAHKSEGARRVRY